MSEYNGAYRDSTTGLERFVDGKWETISRGA